MEIPDRIGLHRNLFHLLELELHLLLEYIPDECVGNLFTFIEFHLLANHLHVVDLPGLLQEPLCCLAYACFCLFFLLILLHQILQELLILISLSHQQPYNTHGDAESFSRLLMCLLLNENCVYNVDLLS